MADELEMLEQLTKDFSGFKTKAKQERDMAIKEITDKMEKGLKDAKEASDRQLAELTKKVDEANTDLAAKGATVNQLMQAVEEFKAKQGRIISVGEEGGISTVQILKDAFKENADNISNQSKKPRAKIEMELKSAGTMTASANLTGAVQATYANAPALRGRQKLHFRDLVNVIPSATGLWKFYRQNIPVGEGSIDTQVTHGNAKSQLDYDFTEVTVTVDYLAGFVRIAKQMMQDLPFMQSFVSNELVEDYLRAEDLKFFGQIYSGATGVAPSGTTVTAEKIIKVLASLGEADYDPNAIVVTFAVWAKLLNTKPNDYSLPGGGGITISPNGDLMIMGVPVFKTKESYIGTDKVLIGDFTKAAIIQAEGLNVNMYEQDSDNVQKNLVTVKAEARVALAQLRVDAFTWFGAGTT